MRGISIKVCILLLRYVSHLPHLDGKRDDNNREASHRPSHGPSPTALSLDHSSHLCPKGDPNP